ncbi:MAG: nucleotidyltransferase family protein [Butyrivibrio sp.]|nr:nucleotidyltransferase family protein [Butyrivibrio sp.]
MNEKIKSIIIQRNTTIIEAVKRMDATSRKLLLVIEKEDFLGVISIGDIQRAIIKGVDLNNPISDIIRDKFTVASVHDDKKVIANNMKERKNEVMPILDDQKKLVDVIFWEDLFEEKNQKKGGDFRLPVVIMAGGQGTRLRPLTNILPKPLIPIGEQTMMEDIMDRFVDYGCHDFYVSVNYKADTIKRYFDALDNPSYNMHYFQEEKPSGTAGSLHLLKDKISSTFFVSNCDIIVDEDYSAILDFHRQNKNEITVVAALKNYAIPYGTLETAEGGMLTGLTEKPNLTFKINTGMYILEPHLINEIPEDEFYHITFLMDKLIKEGRKVGVFPINEGSWTDIGNWDEYMKFVK